MQNTSSCLSCDAESRAKKINILGKEIYAKSYICSPDGITYPEKPDKIKLQMSVLPTSYCPASCPFCIAKDTKTHTLFDLKQFEKTMLLLKKEDCIRGVKITGGEPFYDIGLLDETVSVLYDVFGTELEVSISTNGMFLEKLNKIRHLERIESIHISRHHYDDNVNRRIFGGVEIPSGDKLKEIIKTVSFKDIFVFNCILLKDHINSPEEAHKFLDFAISVGAGKVAFISCMPINEYAKEQAVRYEDVINDGDPSLLFTRRFYDYEFCRCRDGVYASPSGEIIEFYVRSTDAGACEYSRGLVYGADGHLRDGFDGTLIV